MALMNSPSTWPLWEKLRHDAVKDDQFPEEAPRLSGGDHDGPVPAGKSPQPDGIRQTVPEKRAGSPSSPAAASQRYGGRRKKGSGISIWGRNKNSTSPRRNRK